MSYLYGLINIDLNLINKFLYQGSIKKCGGDYRLKVDTIKAGKTSLSTLLDNKPKLMMIKSVIYICALKYQLK